MGCTALIQKCLRWFLRWYANYILERIKQHNQPVKKGDLPLACLTLSSVCNSGPHCFLRRGRGEGSAELFSLVSRDRMHGSGSAVCQRKPRFDIWKHFFTKRRVKLWKTLPGEVVHVSGLLVRSPQNLIGYRREWRTIPKAVNVCLKILFSK